MSIRSKKRKRRKFVGDTARDVGDDAGDNGAGNTYHGTDASEKMDCKAPVWKVVKPGCELQGQMIAYEAR